MSVYNILAADLVCPHCGTQSMMDVNLYFGRRDLERFKLGDEYQWTVKGGPTKGGRPPDGNCDGEGYTECPACARDFFVIVRVENDRLVSAKPNPKKPGYTQSKPP